MKSKIAMALCPIIICAILGFLINNWIDSLATKIDLLNVYLSKADAESQYITKSDHNLYITRLSVVEEKMIDLKNTVSEMHGDLKTIMIIMAGETCTSGDEVCKEKNKIEVVKNGH